MRALFTHGHATSRPEGQLYTILCRAFGDKGVRRQLRMGRWTVDFYVEPLDAYVELDGEYWHGLDRPLDEIAKCATRTDRKILATHHSDRMQDQWFSDNSLRLIRITDKELRRLPEREIVDRVRAAGLSPHIP